MNTMKEVIDYLKDKEYTFLIYKNEDSWASEGINPFQKLNEETK